MVLERDYKLQEIAGSKTCTGFTVSSFTWRLRFRLMVAGLQMLMKVFAIPETKCLLLNNIPLLLTKFKFNLTCINCFSYFRIESCICSAASKT